MYLGIYTAVLFVLHSSTARPWYIRIVCGTQAQGAAPRRLVAEDLRAAARASAALRLHKGGDALGPSL